MTRKSSYHWHLRQHHGRARHLEDHRARSPLLRERGRQPVSAAQVYRLVTDKPERLSMQTLAALCDIFDCTPAT